MEYNQRSCEMGPRRNIPRGEQNQPHLRVSTIFSARLKGKGKILGLLLLLDEIVCTVSAERASDYCRGFFVGRQRIKSFFFF